MDLLVYLLLIGHIYGAFTLKILGVHPVPVNSHYILASTLMNALAERGHDVTVIAPFRNKNPPKNGTFRDIILTGFVEMQDEYMEKFDFQNPISMNLFSMMNLMKQMILNTTENTLKRENVKKLLNSKETFDVVIVEEYMNHAHKGFAAHFNAPLITYTSTGPCSWLNDLIANPTPLSYIPEMPLEYSSDMTFFERFVNVFAYLGIKAFIELYVYPRQAEIMRTLLPNTPDFYDVLYNSSLILVNSHPIINQPVPLVPNLIEIGGFHVKPPKKLPKNLQEFLDSAKDGVIYFSMGSNLKSRVLPLEKRDALLKAFAKLKEKVLWKWEDEELPGKPENVKIGKWLPQQDILAHPNVKLFITHAGLLSSIETVYHGVPILAIPIYGDQMANSAKAVNYGYALKLSYSDLTEEKLSEKLNELLHNPKYRETAKFRSKIFHDQQVKPLDRATYWIEYVARHGRAEHLQVAGVKLPWYKYHLLDVIAFAFFIVLIFNTLLFLFVKKICFGKKQKLKTS